MTITPTYTPAPAALKVAAWIDDEAARHRHLSEWLDPFIDLLDDLAERVRTDPSLASGADVAADDPRDFLFTLRNLDPTDEWCECEVDRLVDHLDLNLDDAEVGA